LSILFLRFLIFFPFLSLFCTFFMYMHSLHLVQFFLFFSCKFKSFSLFCSHGLFYPFLPCLNIWI
jgi:hypothetical protein